MASCDNSRSSRSGNLIQVKTCTGAMGPHDARSRVAWASGAGEPKSLMTDRRFSVARVEARATLEQLVDQRIVSVVAAFEESPPRNNLSDDRR